MYWINSDKMGTLNKLHDDNQNELYAAVSEKSCGVFATVLFDNSLVLIDAAAV